MDDAVRMERPDRLAELEGQLARVLLGKAPARRDELLEVLPGHVVADHDELVGHLVGGLHVGKACAVALHERRPHAAARQLGGDALADEGAGAVERHQLGHAARTLREDALDAIGVVDAHGMHDLLVVQPCASLGRSEHNHCKGYIQPTTDSSVRS